MGQFISAFEVNATSGGGSVTGKLIEVFKSDIQGVAMRSNSESLAKRVLRGLLNWILTPTLHPVFCMYNSSPGQGINILNFSQTFGIMFRYPKHEFALIAHDVLIQKRLFPSWWIKYSERRLFAAAKRIFVLSEKDARILRRYYRIDAQRVVSLLPVLYPNLASFSSIVRRQGKFRVAFLGSLNRVENLRSLSWFYDSVYRNCSDTTEVYCIGETTRSLIGDFPEVTFVGRVEDLSSELVKYDLTIAPIMDGAGIKIKVVDSLLSHVPVLGTPKAFEGLGRPNVECCSTNPDNWISTLRSEEIIFRYNFVGKKESTTFECAAIGRIS